MINSSFKQKKPKEKSCVICKSKFSPHQFFISWCSPDCGYQVSQQRIAKSSILAAKADRAEIKAKKESIKSRAEWLKEAQTVFNKFIRLRDKYLPCVSCGRFHKGQWHAGHFLSVGAHPELRFNELNVSKQCQPCNTHLSGNALNFRKGLIAREGIEIVEFLEGYHEPKKYHIDEIREIIIEYKLKIKELERKYEKQSI